MRSSTMFRLLAGLSLLVPLTALAAQPCEHSAARSLALDLTGVKAVVFEVNSHDLRLSASPGAPAALKGRACAFKADALKQLTVTQTRQGDKLVVRLDRDGPLFKLFGDHYAYLDITGTLPDNLPVQLVVGSGDAQIDGASIVSADVGSGDARIHRTRGLVAATVGSGDVEIDVAGSLKIIAINSGDAIARDIRGAVEVGEIGSGDFELERATGNVSIGSIGSGNATVRNVGGNVQVGRVGSGNIEARDVRGTLTVEDIGSGDIEHAGVAGAISLPKTYQGD